MEVLKAPESFHQFRNESFLFTAFSSPLSGMVHPPFAQGVKNEVLGLSLDT